MAHTRAWTNFKRMQDTTVAAASLIYAGAVLHAGQVLPGDVVTKLETMLIWPGVFLTASLALPLLVDGMRRLLMRYVWMSFLSGFGQTVISVLIGLGLLFAAAMLIYRHIDAVEAGGRYPVGLFAGYAAGIGILIAQALLVRRLERVPEVAEAIEAPD